MNTPPQSMLLTPEQVISGIRSLPSLPAIVMDLLQSMDMESVDTQLLADKISLDQGMTAASLRLANSAFYGMPTQVKSVEQAIALLGLSTIRTLIVAAAVTQFRPGPQSGFNFSEYWQQAIGTAVCARQLAPLLQQSPDTAFLAGLLHNIGQLLIAECFPAIYAAIANRQALSGCSVSDAEQMIMGTDHAAIGSALSAHWRFPPQIVEAIGAHRDTHDRLAQVVWLATLLAPALTLAGKVPSTPIDAALRIRIELDDTCFDQFSEQIEAERATICQVLLR